MSSEKGFFTFFSQKWMVQITPVDGNPRKTNKVNFQHLWHQGTGCTKPVIPIKAFKP